MKTVVVRKLDAKVKKVTHSLCPEDRANRDGFRNLGTETAGRTDEGRAGKVHGRLPTMCTATGGRSRGTPPCGGGTAGGRQKRPGDAAARAEAAEET